MLISSPLRNKVQSFNLSLSLSLSLSLTVSSFSSGKCFSPHFHSFRIWYVTVSLSLYHYQCVSFLSSVSLSDTEKFPAFDFVIGMYSTTTKEKEKDLLFSL